MFVAALILTGLDHRLEAVLVAASPAWLTDITTRFYRDRHASISQRTRDDGKAPAP